MSTKSLFFVEILNADKVVQQKQVLDGAHYVALPHESEYVIRLQNRSQRDCDAEVKIDGEVVGKWRVPAGVTECDLERGAKVERKFTFVKDSSFEAASCGVQANHAQNGLIMVTFSPELKRYYEPYQGMATYGSFSFGASRGYGAGMEAFSFGGGPTTFACALGSTGGSSTGFGSTGFGAPPALNTKAITSGATVLGAASDQRFGKARALEYDHASVETIMLRLVVGAPLAVPKYIPIQSRYPIPVSEMDMRD